MKKELTLGPITITPTRKRSAEEHMGRFGGGWQWNLGIQIGTISRQHGFSGIVNLLTRSVRFSYRPKGSRYRKDQD